MPMKLYLDFEATGLEPSEADIIQIGAILEKDGKNVAEFEALVKTNKTISPKVYEITKINNKLLENEASFESVLDNFKTWLSNQRENKKDEVVIIAYNALRYDIPLLCHNLQKNNFDLKQFFYDCGIKSFADPLIWGRINLNTCSLIRNKRGRCSYRLGDVFKSLFGKSFENAHNALADSDALMKICNHIQFKKMKYVIDRKSVFDIERFVHSLKMTKKKKCLFLGTKRKLNSEECNQNNDICKSNVCQKKMKVSVHVKNER